MPKLIIMSDLHGKRDEPFFSAQKEFYKWFISQEFNNNENVLLDLGDIFDVSVPNPSVYDEVFNFYNQMKFKRKIILCGNHCYNRSRNSYAESPLSNIKNTEIVYNPIEMNIENMKCLMLPYIYDKTFSNEKTMKDLYENLEKYSKDFYDFIFYHFQDNSIKFTKEDESGINIDYLKGEKIGGHIHKRQKNYLGSVLINRYDEKNKNSFVLVIDLETKEKEYIQVPRFLDYWEISYDDNLPPQDLKLFRIFDIIDAPSKSAAYEKFKGLYIHDIKIKKNKEEILEEQVEMKSDKNINQLFNDFCKKNKIEKKVKERVIQYIK